MTSANADVIWQVIAACYDNPIPGYGTNTVGNLRLWESKPVNEFKLDEFNEGHYVEVGCKASVDKLSACNSPVETTACHCDSVFIVT